MKRWIFGTLILSTYAGLLWAAPASTEKFEVHRDSIIEKISRHSDAFEIDPSLTELMLLRRKINFFMTYPRSTFEHSVTRADGSVVYQKTYHTDKYVRQTPQGTAAKNEHFIIAGDSNIFGLGANDNETMSAQIALNLPKKEVYNLGIPGAGPNFLLSYLEKNSLDQNVRLATPKGTLIYDFSYYLIERVTGSVNCIEWCKSFPYYSLDQSGQLKLDGTIAEHWAGKLYLFLKAFPFSQKLFPNLPKISSEHMLLTAAILEKIKRKYLEQTDKNNQFYISINPFFNGKIEAKLNDEFIQLLRSRQFKVLTYSPMAFLKEDHYEDGHLTPAALKTYADILLKKLKAIEPEKF